MKMNNNIGENDDPEHTGKLSIAEKNHRTSVSTVTKLWDGQLEFVSQQRKRIFSHHCIQASSVAHITSDGFWECLPWGLSGQGMKLTTHLSLVPRLRIHNSWSYTPTPHTSSWHGV
jgi:hypothetical protein